jgi:hypothetical protein
MLYNIAINLHPSIRTAALFLPSHGEKLSCASRERESNALAAICSLAMSMMKRLSFRQLINKLPFPITHIRASDATMMARRVVAFVLRIDLT